LAGGTSVEYLLRTWVLLRLDANKHPGQAWISGQEKRLGMPSCSWDLGLGTKSRDRSVAPASVLRLEGKRRGGVGEEGNFPHSQGSRLRNHNPAAACGLAHPSEPRPADLARMGFAAEAQLFFLSLQVRAVRVLLPQPDHGRECARVASECCVATSYLTEGSGGHGEFDKLCSSPVGNERRNDHTCYLTYICISNIHEPLCVC
jgi:hypothetical protein